MSDISDSYTSIARPGHAAVHCEVLTGRLVMSGQCWGEVSLVEIRLLGKAAPRCQGHAGAVYRPEPAPQLPEDLRRRLAMAERGLATIGWRIVDLDVDAVAGTGRAEFRSSEGRVLRVVADQRGAMLERDQERTVQRPAREIPLGYGLNPKHRGGPVIEVHREFLGRSRAADFPEAMREAVAYMLDNRPAALGTGEPTTRQRQLTRAARGLLARAVEKLSPKIPAPEPRREAELTPMREDWLEDCERTTCLGDGFDPYIPSVTAGDCYGRKWIATSGLIVDGRGVHREGTYARGPMGNRRTEGDHARA